MDKAENLRKQFQADLSRITTADGLETLSIKYLGRSGSVNELLRQIKEIPADQKKEFGQKVNETKNWISAQIKEKQNKLAEAVPTTIDPTLPGDEYPQGSLHVITLAIEEISRIFQKIGFVRMSYPEVEWEFFSFEALNMPKSHPARDDFEASFVDFPEHKDYGRMVLTPHTSSGQIREMWRLGKPPVRMINIAKCYRPNWDPTHTPMFYQFEGLCVDKGINITHLKGTLDYFAKEYFGENVKTRLRPHHFQFTEPSFEVDITCTACNGTGDVQGERCRICKSGWLELGGTGMVHPNVLKFGKIDPREYSGWAFGFGIERVVMMKYGIDDIRYYYSGDIRFLKQF